MVILCDVHWFSYIFHVCLPKTRYLWYCSVTTSSLPGNWMSWTFPPKCPSFWSSSQVAGQSFLYFLCFFLCCWWYFSWFHFLKSCFGQLFYFSCFFGFVCFVFARRSAWWGRDWGHWQRRIWRLWGDCFDFFRAVLSFFGQGIVLGQLDKTWWLKNTATWKV